MDPALASKLQTLNKIFKQYDTDNDGQVDEYQIQQMMKDMEYDIYLGTVKKIIRLMNIDNPQKTTLDFLQVEELATAYATKSKFQIWKAKYQVKSAVDEVKHDLFNGQQNYPSTGQAGPGASSQNFQGKNQEGQIHINVGNQTHESQYISFSLQKKKGPQISPFVKIQIQRSSKQAAQKCKQIFDSIYQTMITILQSQQQEFIDEIKNISFNPEVVGNCFCLTITTPNKELNQLIQLTSEYLDMCLETQPEGKIEGSFKFNFDFGKFVLDQKYSFYDMIVNNSSFSLKWNVWNLFKNLRKALLKVISEHVQWDQTDPVSIFLIGFLHCERFVGKLQFENTPSNNQETESKEEIAKFLSEMSASLKDLDQDTNMGLIDFLKEFQGKMTIEAQVKEWRLHVDLKLGDITKLIFNDIKFAKDEETEQVQQQSAPGGEQQQCDEDSEEVVLNKSSSKKSLKKKSSVKQIITMGQWQEKALSKKSSQKSFESCEGTKAKKEETTE